MTRPSLFGAFFILCSVWIELSQPHVDSAFEAGQPSNRWLDLCRMVLGLSGAALLLWAVFKNDRFCEDFARRKEREQKDRSRRFGGQVYLLEPNLKDGKGGLRDYHHMGQVMKSVQSTTSVGHSA